ncbi:hypothetical protein V6N13_001970 [Hibiscus sabdariffa]
MGEFEAMGVNVNHSHDCEKVTVLITTSKVGRIEEVIELEAGKNIFLVNVRELGFSDGASYPLRNEGDKDKVKGKRWRIRKAFQTRNRRARNHRR